jgi:hypothetical protein
VALRLVAFFLVALRFVTLRFLATLRFAAFFLAAMSKLLDQRLRGITKHHPRAGSVLLLFSIGLYKKNFAQNAPLIWTSGKKKLKVCLLVGFLFGKGAISTPKRLHQRHGLKFAFNGDGDFTFFDHRSCQFHAPHGAIWKQNPNLLDVGNELPFGVASRF